MKFLVEKKRQFYTALAGLCTLLHMVENFALVVLTYISSLDNRGKSCSQANNIVLEKCFWENFKKKKKKKKKKSIEKKEI